VVPATVGRLVRPEAEEPEAGAAGPLAPLSTVFICRMVRPWVVGE
jgi:hypothetical protein